MKKRLLFSLLLCVLVVAPIFSVSACGSEPVTGFTVAYPGGFTGLVSVDPCGFSYSGPSNPTVFETLVGQDENDAVVGRLAEDWSWSADGLTLTVNLLPDVKFSSGDPFTADDVGFSLERHAELDMPVIAQLSPGQGYDGYEVIDEHTIQFNFTKVNVQFVPQTLMNMGITSKAYYDRVGEDAYVDAPVGTGPYKIVDWEEGQYVDVALNEYWRGDEPQIQTARFLSVTDGATRAAMLQAGEVDLATEIPGASITALENAGFKGVYMTAPHALAIEFNLLSAGTPWSDVRVRQAINYAIDKESLAESMICGPVEEGAWAFTTAPWYDSSLKPAYDYDLDKARELMEDAGYEDGFTFPITYLATPTVTPLADYLASALAAINITVELSSLASMPEYMPAIAAIHNDYVDGKEIPPTVGAFLSDPGWPGNPEAAIDLTNGFYMAKDNTLFDDPDVDAIVGMVLSTIDDETRWDYAKQAWAAIDEVLPQIPVALEVYTHFMKSNITYTKSVGDVMYAGPIQLIDLTID